MRVPLRQHSWQIIRLSLVLLALLGSAGLWIHEQHPHAQQTPQISTDRLQSHVTALTSEACEGRLTGTRGEQLATDYVAEQFQQIGLLPLSEANSYFHEFEFTSGMALGESNQFLQVGSTQAFALNTEWRPLAFSSTGHSGPAGVVFVGYGLVAPAQGDGPEDQPGYDAYAGIDVHGQWVMMFRYGPENVLEARRHYLDQFSGLRQKALQARERGALGIIVVSGPRSGVKNQLVSLQGDATLSGSEIFALSVTDTLAQLWLGSHSLVELQSALDAGEPITGFPLSDIQLQTNVDITRVRKIGRNVLARLSVAEHPTPKVLFIGAHVDHLGRGDSSSSRATESEEGQIHFGADDNASGVAGLLELAKYFSDRKLSGESMGLHDLVFAAWSGEELGLLGSTHFLKRWTEDKPGIVAYLNMDMIGRLRETLVVQGTGSSAAWDVLLTPIAEARSLPLTLQSDPYLPTDAMSFYLKHIPVLSLFTGSHEEYHTPRDTIEKINFDGLTQTVIFASQIVEALENPQLSIEYREVSSPIGRGRGGFRVYLGTIPDYSAEDVVGVRLSGIKSSSPASEAGLMSGDVVIELDGRVVRNIYDYTEIIRSLRPSRAALIKVIRGTETLELRIVPVSRD